MVIATTYDADGQRSGQAHSGGSTGGGEATGDDIPTLGEWGAILLGSVLLLVLVRRSRRPGLATWLLIVLPGAGMILQITDAHASDATYTYDSNGNILTRSVPDTTTYSYDALDRLTREQGPVITQSFGFDASSNRTSDGAGSYVYAPASNRLTTRPQGPVTLDPAGHTTAQAGFTYTWDGPGRLKTVSLSGQLLATYHYDTRHRRTRKETTASAPQGVATVLYAYDRDDHLLAETDATGPIRSYLWRDDTPVAQIDHRPSRKVLYLETDHLGSPRSARNEAGVLVWRWESDAFGSSLPDEDPDGDGTPTTVNLRYPGQYFDQESGLHYNQARYYDPTTGRYLSPDPIGLAGGINTYTYVGGNPLSRVDPTGEIAIADDVIIGGTVLAAGCAITPACRQAVRDAVSGLGNLLFAKPFVNDPQAQAEHDDYKRRYSEPPPPFKDSCDELRWRLKREEDLLRARQAWDAKWLPGRHAGMSGEIQSQNAIRRIKEKMKQQGCDCS